MDDLLSLLTGAFEMGDPFYATYFPHTEKPISTIDTCARDEQNSEM